MTYRDGYVEGQQDQRDKDLRLDDVEHSTQWASATEEWKEGWSDGYQSLVRG